MKKYLSFFKISFSNTIQYRGAAIAGIVTQLFWGFMEIMLFRAFYEADKNAFPMEFSALCSYIWLQQAFLTLFMIWFFDLKIFKQIQDGGIGYELARPLELYNMWFAGNAAQRMAKATLRCFPVLLVAFLLPHPYGLVLPASIGSFFAFLVSMVLAFLTVLAFCMLVYITTFYTLSPYGVRIIVTSVTELLTGALIPIPFLPEWMQNVLRFTPFYSMQNLPYRIYSEDIWGGEALFAILLQLVWVVILIIIGKLWMKRALRRVVIQGG